MKDNRIPKNIQIMGRKIDIVWDKTLLDKWDAKGITVYRENKIVLFKDGSNETRTKDTMYETYIHEVTHWILELICEKEKNDDEKFVSLFSRCLSQVLISGEYE